MTTIRINNAKFYAYHGVHDYEKEYGNLFEVDIEMQCDLSSLGDSDDLSKTVDYQAVYKVVEKVFVQKKFNLIESVNMHICGEILDNFPHISSVKMSIRKPNAPLGIIDSVEVEFKLDRQ